MKRVLILFLLLILCFSSFALAEERDPVDQKVSLIYFHVNGGESIPYALYMVGEIPDLPTPVYEGHIFIGWYTDTLLTEPFDPETQMPYESLHLYARWQWPDWSDFTFEVDEGKATLIAYQGAGGVVTVPSSAGGATVTKIGEFVFSDNQTVTSIQLPDTVLSVGAYAFRGCSAVSVNLGANVVELGRSAFADCEKLKSVSLGRSLAEIPARAFENCAALTGFTLPSTTVKIGKRAFANCEGLTELRFPEGLVEICDEAFKGCAGLKTVHLPASFGGLGEGAFSGCSALKRFEVSEGGNFYALDGVLCAGFFLASYPPAKEGTSYTIPSEVSMIYDQAFSGAVNLRTVTVPAHVMTLGMGCFASCLALESVIFEPGSFIMDLPADVFSGCANLQSVTLPDWLFAIGSGAFAGCEKLALLKLADDLEIAKDSFRGCSSLILVARKNSAVAFMADWTGCRVRFLGDLNGDDRISREDAELLADALVGNAALSAIQKLASDFNDDGAVDNKDVVAILREVGF